MTPIADEIASDALDRLAEGETLAEIARSYKINRIRLLRHLKRDPDAEAAYLQARCDGLDARAEELEEIAGEEIERLPSGGIDAASVAQLRLRVDTRKWMLAKLASNKYGDKIEIEQRTTITDLTDEHLDAKLASLAGIAGQIGQAAIAATTGREGETQDD